MILHAFLTLMLTWMSFPVSSEKQKVVTNFIGISPPSAIQDSTKIANPGKNKEIIFGIKVGAGLSNTNFNQGFPKPAISVQTNWKGSFQTSLYVEIPLYNKFSLQQEYGYARLIGEIDEQKKEYLLSYLTLPLILKYSITPELAIEAGPQFDILINAKEQINENARNIIHEVEERNIGVILGLEYNINSKIGLDARLIQGINHINIKYDSEFKEFKLQVIQFSLKINLIK